MIKILFDLGKTKTRIAFSSSEDKFETPIVFKTGNDYKNWLDTFESKALELSKKKEIKYICGGMSRSIENFSSEQLKIDLENIFGAKVFIENDSAMVALGEAVYGAGRGYDIVAYITVSTGVGGARIVDKKIDEKAIGFEPGNQIIDLENGLAKTLESLISGRALKEKTGKEPKEILDQNVWEEHAQLLAVGLHNVIVNWSPHCIVLGGSMITGDPAIPIDRLPEYIEANLKIFPQIPDIKKAELGDFGGLYGALEYFKQLNT